MTTEHHLGVCHFQPKQTRLSLTNLATHLCKCNGVADLLKHAPLRMCYHAEFGRSALKGVDKYRRTPNLVSAGTPLS